MVEVWKDIKGYKGLYQISNLGRVKSLNYKRTGKEKILKSRVNKNGYCYVDLYKDGKCKRYRIHRLVAMAFVDGYEEGLVVNHIDEDKTNNCAWNLEWVTQQYNISYSSYKWSGENSCMHSKSDENHPVSKKVICIDSGQIFPSLTKAGEFIGVSCGAIYKAIKEGRSCKGLHWQYVE